MGFDGVPVLRILGGEARKSETPYSGDPTIAVILNDKSPYGVGINVGKISLTFSYKFYKRRVANEEMFIF